MEGSNEAFIFFVIIFGTAFSSHKVGLINVDISALLSQKVGTSVVIFPFSGKLSSSSFLDKFSTFYNGARDMIDSSPKLYPVLSVHLAMYAGTSSVFHSTKVKKGQSLQDYKFDPDDIVSDASVIIEFKKGRL